MLKLNASYSKKVPGDLEFSSEGYMCSVELELSDNLDPRELQTRIHDTFALVKGSVEAELGHARSSRRNGGNGNGYHPHRSNRHAQGGNGTNGNGKATTKQLSYLTSLAAERGIGLTELNADLSGRFGVNDLYGLSRKQASQLLDELKAA